MATWVTGNRYLTQSEMDNNATIVWDVLGGAGWSLNAVSGMLGNMQSESNINPGLWESLDEGNLNGGYGLTQWTPASKYIDWAGAGYDSGYKQLDRIVWEKDTGNQWFRNPAAPIVNPPITFAEFSVSTEAVATLAYYFLWYYEHPANINQPQRATQAAYYYELLSGHPPDPPGPGGSGHRMKLLYYLRPL